MEKEKYYTPIIEEFYVGFECEILGIIGAKKDQRLFSKPTIISKKELKLLELLETRVKCLDKEDIESLGFKLMITKSIGKDHYTMIGEISTRGNLLLEHDWLNDKITIKTPNYIRNYTGDFCGYIIYVYKLIIKNKSELIKLMQQLNIK